MPSDSSDLSSLIRESAYEAGFHLVGIAPAVSPTGFDHLRDWLERGFAGEMQWMERRLDAYEDPAMVLQNVRSVVMVGLNYGSVEPVEPTPGQGRVSRYAWNDTDYHSIIRQKLKSVAAAVRATDPAVRTRAVVDTAPLLERDFARLAGLGWFGKNTMLINKWQGSWFFLGALLLDCELVYDKPHETSHCGTCTRCLEACPTDAFPEPYVLDATKCISYLSIELRDQPVPEPLRAGMQDWVFGCDICQDVCPWNRKAPDGNDLFQPLPGMNPIDCLDLLALSEGEFQTKFKGTPMERTGRDTLVRSAAIVLGNTAGEAAIPCLDAACDVSKPVVTEACRWAIYQIQSRIAD
ncbi:MAG: tRNA epoxyqueuosine(34) reductase QueG [Planctomycetaceae bacterium]